MAKKLKKYPKSPKASASLATWEKYKTKCQEVDRDNAKAKLDVSKKESVKKSVAALKSKRK